MFLVFRTCHLGPNVAANKLKRNPLMHLRETRRRKMPGGLAFPPIAARVWPEAVCLSCKLADLPTQPPRKRLRPTL